MSVNGIDVASYQGATYSTAGLDFVMVKATEGTGYVNPRHDGQVATGRAHSLVVGHYHFVRPGSITTQAAYFLQHAVPQPGDILCLDWEDAGVSGAEKDAWIKHVQAAAPGHRVILYCNRDFWLNRDTTSFCGDGLWIADPGAAPGHPRVDHPWTFHQYSEAGGLDRDVANLPTRAALQAWAAGQPLNPEDTMPTPAEYAAAVAKAVTAADARDTLAIAPFYWARYLLDPGLPLPTGKGAPAVATQIATLRPLLAKFIAEHAAPQLTDEQVVQIATTIAASPALAGTFAEAVAEKLAARLQS